MSVQVNPPPQLRIPEKFFNDPESRRFFEQQRTILFQLWQRTGGSQDLVAGQKIVVIAGSDLILESFGSLIIVEADTAPVIITLPVITSNDVGESITVEIFDAKFDTNVFAGVGSTVVEDTDVLMNEQYMSITFTAITASHWVIT